MKTADFDYVLPEELIAQQPAARREEARLLVVHRATRTVEHRRFFELPEFLRAGDQLLRNTARVRPARLLAQRPGGGRVECLLLRPETTDRDAARLRHASARQATDGPVVPGMKPEGVDRFGGRVSDAPRLRNSVRGASETRPPRDALERWWCLLRPGRRLPPGATFGEDGEFTACVVQKSAMAEYLVEFALARAGESVAALAERLGRVPLPPYIHRPKSGMADPAAAEDRTRYQTVFADRAHTVAVAAPTAGLHFSEALLARLADEGVEFADVVLHVGLGTFRPIETEDVAAHPIHRERIEIPAATQARLARGVAGRRIAVGTTAVRAVEHWARAVAGVGDPGPDPPPSTSSGQARPAPTTTLAANTQSAKIDFVGEADLFIHPPATFHVIDGLITNFHLPRSTLLCLVAAFLTPGSADGAAWLREIYAEAMRERYRFLSYGDAMLIL